MKWFVSRQVYYPEGTPIVEVAAGGLDYANPDALDSGSFWRALGEGEDYKDPREAVEAAIRICNAWRKRGERKAKVAHGATAGFTLPFDATTYREAREWAERKYEALPKCAGCTYPLPEKRERWHADDWSGLEYCSDYCAEKEAEWQEQERARLDALDAEANEGKE